MDFPTASSALFHLAPDPDYPARLTKEIQSTRELLEARVAALASPSVTDPKEIVALKKTLNILCTRTQQKSSLAKRLRCKLDEERRERNVAEGEVENAGEMISRIRKIASEIECVNKQTLEEESHSFSYSSLKSKESASLLISKERVQELESLRSRLLRKYEVIQQTRFKADSHLTLMHGELRRELKSAQSIRRRQEHYAELAENVRVQRQETVEREIEAVSKAKLSREDQHKSAKLQLFRLQAEVKGLESARKQVKERKEAIAAFQAHYSVLESLVPGTSSNSSDFPQRIIAKFREMGQEQLSLSGRFHDLSADHDVKKKQCEDIRAELERLRAGIVQGEVHWKGSVNMIRAAVEDNQKYKKLKKESHDSEQLVLGLYLKLSHFLTSVLLRVQGVCTESGLSAAVSGLLAQMRESVPVEQKKEQKETTSGKRRNSLKTFQTEIDVPSLKAALTYALSVEDIRRALVRFHPDLALEAHYIAVQLHCIPSVAHFLSLPKLEAYFESVSSSAILQNCGGLITAGYSILQQKLATLRNSFPILSAVKSLVDSTDMNALIPPPVSKQKPPHTTPRIRKLTVEGPEDAPRFSENLSGSRESDEDEAAYLQHTRREVKETGLRAKTIDLPRSVSLPKVDSNIATFPRKQGVVLRLAQLEDKLKLLRESEKSAIEHLKRQRGMSATQGRWDESRSARGATSFRSLSSAGSGETRPGTSAFRFRPSLNSSRLPSSDSLRPKTVYTATRL